MGLNAISDDGTLIVGSAKAPGKDKYHYAKAASFQVELVPNIDLAIRKETTGWFFWKKSRTIIEWSGASGDVDVYREKSCNRGSGRGEDCFVLRNVAQGSSEGSLEFEYIAYDRFMVCESGTDINAEGFEKFCSKPHQIEE